MGAVTQVNSNLSSWSLTARTLYRIGLQNVLRVALYRTLLRMGVHPVQSVRREIGGVHFFRLPTTRITLQAPEQWSTCATYFGWYKLPLTDSPPNWFANPFAGAQVPHAELPWWKLSDFDHGAGDIKTIWEASRFDWVVAFAQRGLVGEAEAIELLNGWLSDWVHTNPAYFGPNWKCGQEASIRVLHLLLAARLLGQLDNPEQELVHLVEAHLARIHPTIAYAMAQDNNHGTSEAAALYIAGSWCAQHGIGRGRAWAKTGRSWLENRVARLIEPDGSFSQHSVNYHRLMLDSLSLCELFRRDFSDSPFSARLYARTAAATKWLWVMTNATTGDTPNLGANDGANLLPLTDAEYRDYRPSVQLAAVLFHPDCSFVAEGPHQDQLRWLGLEIPRTVDQSVAQEAFHAAGYILLKKEQLTLLFRYPYYRFRPGHSDALHVDVWQGTTNILRDAGSYSYNTEPDLAAYFSGPKGHNNIQFDERDPMPKLGRFLWGEWLDGRAVEGPEQKDGSLQARAAYRDWLGAWHRRTVTLRAGYVHVTDEIRGFRDKAVLRWRLSPDDWQVEGMMVYHSTASLTISASIPIHSMRLISGWESRYYLQKTSLPVLEVEVREPGRLITELRLLS